MWPQPTQQSQWTLKNTWIELNGRIKNMNIAAWRNRLQKVLKNIFDSKIPEIHWRFLSRSLTYSLWCASSDGMIYASKLKATIFSRRALSLSKAELLKGVWHFEESYRPHFIGNFKIKQKPSYAWLGTQYENQHQLEKNCLHFQDETTNTREK